MKYQRLLSLALLFAGTPAFCISTVSLGGSYPDYLHGLRTNNLGSLQMRQDSAAPPGFSDLSPLKGALVVINSFGFSQKTEKYSIPNIIHLGVDLKAAVGDDVYAVRDGVVKVATLDAEFGGYLVVQHPNGVASLYGHLSRITVQIGQTVRKGSVIGKVGQTGLVAAPALHFALAAGTSYYFDPTTLLHK